MGKPNFFVIGAQRAGTTFFCQLLARHPRVFFSDPKEPGYFSSPGADLASYERLFENAGLHMAVGEGSTRYSQCATYPGTAQRIARYQPAARIIYIVRDPIERMRSAWVQYRSEAFHPMHSSFDSAIRTHPELFDASSYSLQITEYENWFPPAQILVLFFEELRRNPLEAAADCFSFLGLDTAEIGVDAISFNESAGKVSDRGGVRLMRRFKVDQALRALLPEETSVARRAARRVLKTGVAKPDLTESTSRFLRERLQSDAQSFLERFGRTADLWPVTFP